MPSYEYRCQDCQNLFSIERSMNDQTQASCWSCGSNQVSRIWNANIAASTGAKKQGAPKGSIPTPNPKSHGSCCGGGCH